MKMKKADRCSSLFTWRYHHVDCTDYQYAAGCAARDQYLAGIYHFVHNDVYKRSVGFVFLSNSIAVHNDLQNRSERFIDPFDLIDG